MATFITSDSHFHHRNILDFEPRPFANVEEMEEGMIAAWNAAVKKTDTVYHLGDFSFGNAAQWENVLNRLHGKITIIKGNHDKSKILSRMKRDGMIEDYHPLGTVIKSDGLIINLCHYPMQIGIRPRIFSVHGHLHSHESAFLNHVNIGVDSVFAKSLGKPFGTPIALEELVSHLLTLVPLLEEEKEAFRNESGN